MRITKIIIDTACLIKLITKSFHRSPKTKKISAARVGRRLATVWRQLSRQSVNMSCYGSRTREGRTFGRSCGRGVTYSVLGNTVRLFAEDDGERYYTCSWDLFRVCGNGCAVSEGLYSYAVSFCCICRSACCRREMLFLFCASTVGCTS